MYRISTIDDFEMQVIAWVYDGLEIVGKAGAKPSNSTVNPQDNVSFRTAISWAKKGHAFIQQQDSLNPLQRKRAQAFSFICATLSHLMKSFDDELKFLRDISDVEDATTSPDLTIIALLMSAYAKASKQRDTGVPVEVGFNLAMEKVRRCKDRVRMLVASVPIETRLAPLNLVWHPQDQLELIVFTRSALQRLDLARA